MSGNRTPVVHYADFLRAIKDAGWTLSRRGTNSLTFQRGKAKATIPDLNSGRPDINPEQVKDWCERFGISWPPEKPKGDPGRPLTDRELEEQRIRLEAQHAPAAPMVRKPIPGGTMLIGREAKSGQARKAAATRRARRAAGAYGLATDPVLVQRALELFGPLQRQLAVKLDTDQSMISRWRRGERIMFKKPVAAYRRMEALVAKAEEDAAALKLQETVGTAFKAADEIEADHRLDHDAIEHQMENARPAPERSAPVAVSSALRAAGAEITGQQVIRYIERLEAEVKALRAVRADITESELATLRRKARKWDQFKSLATDD